MTQWSTAAMDRAFATHPPAIAIKWRDPNQRRNFTPNELSQLWHSRQE